MTEFCLNTIKYMFSFTIFILPIIYYVYPPKILPKYCLQFWLRVYKVYDVQYEMVNIKTRASGLTLKKRPKGYSKMERYFSRFTLESAGSLTTLGRRGGGIGFLVHCRKEDLVYTRSEYMCVVSKVLLSLNTGQ